MCEICERESFVPERFRAKWAPVCVEKTRQNKKPEPRSDSIGTEKALSRRALSLFAISAVGLALAGKAGAKEDKPPPKPENVLSPDDALKRLLKGNERYVKGEMQRHDFKREREALAGGQNPYAAILSCADSRIAPEYAFDSGRGDLFVCRIAGNFAGTETVASLEYAVAVLHTPLILVLGHEGCGAVDATIKSLRDEKSLPGHLPYLVAAIAPAVKPASSQSGDALDNAIRQNVVDNVAKLKSAAPILNSAVDEKKLKVVGGIYRLKSGQVDIVA
jgi:carbonic anhydrase